ncbi:toll/interleukin-1 receptor domain-containing protein [Sorangium sp. So ce119]|uniref:toll/interleukin-1 receptor domain-containing protein n=1 Tax=Sorangium sp. So ce119 TaxID=3133279 RepID=UPI003F60714A
MTNPPRFFEDRRKLRRLLRARLVQAAPMLPPAAVERVIDGISDRLREDVGGAPAGGPSEFNRFPLARWVVREIDLRTIDRVCELITSVPGMLEQPASPSAAAPPLVAVSVIAFAILRRSAACLTDIHVRLLSLLAQVAPSCVSPAELTRKLDSRTTTRVDETSVSAVLEELSQVRFRDGTLHPFVRRCADGAGWTIVDVTPSAHGTGIANPPIPPDCGPSAQSPAAVPAAPRSQSIDTSSHAPAIPDQPAADLPQPARPATDLPQPARPAARRRVVVSYSHEDAEWLERLQLHLLPLARRGVLDLWDDTRMRPGDVWRTEVAHALARAHTAVLLVSAHFLASDFIMKNELPPLLDSASRGGTLILPVIVGHCLFSQVAELSKYQALNPPSRPLMAMTRADADEVLVKLATTILEDARKL